jgi:hypothetical protein
MDASKRNELIHKIIVTQFKGVRMDSTYYNDRFNALEKLTDVQLEDEKNLVERYRGYTIQKDWRNPYSNTPDFMFYLTEQGVDHDGDFDGEDWHYCGNCRWASSLEDAKAEIDELILELQPA